MLNRTRSTASRQHLSAFGAFLWRSWIMQQSRNIWQGTKLMIVVNVHGNMIGGHLGGQPKSFYGSHTWCCTSQARMKVSISGKGLETSICDWNVGLKCVLRVQFSFFCVCLCVLPYCHLWSHLEAQTGNSLTTMAIAHLKDYWRKYSLASFFPCFILISFKMHVSSHFVVISIYQGLQSFGSGSF